MFRKAVTAVAILGAAVAVSATGAGAAEVAAPQPAPMMGAAEPPEDHDRGPEVATLLQAAGVALVVGGGIIVGRGWVSPEVAG